MSDHDLDPLELIAGCLERLRGNRELADRASASRGRTWVTGRPLGFRKVAVVGGGSAGYLTALASSFDPHSRYLSPSSLRNRQIQRGLALEGIGAALQSRDAGVQVSKIIPGGAADRHGDVLQLLSFHGCRLAADAATHKRRQGTLALADSCLHSQDACAIYGAHRGHSAARAGVAQG